MLSEDGIIFKSKLDFEVLENAKTPAWEILL